MTNELFIEGCFFGKRCLTSFGHSLFRHHFSNAQCKAEKKKSHVSGRRATSTMEEYGELIRISSFKVVYLFRICKLLISGYSVIMKVHCFLQLKIDLGKVGVVYTNKT